jgi:16S rRNA U516 pseudouridylate synthase RsuA-like enzyme
MDTLERLQNLLAKRGIASRRGAADLIREGYVTVDGTTITEPGFRVAETAYSESVVLNGRISKNRADEFIGTVNEVTSGRAKSEILQEIFDF